MRNQRRQNLNTHLNSQSAQAAAQLQGSQMQQMQQQQQQQRSSETSLAIALMGIVIMHIGIDFRSHFTQKMEIGNSVSLDNKTFLQLTF